MKLEKNSIVAIAFVVTFVILLLFSLLTSGFRIDMKGLFVAVYFAVWIAAAVFVLMTFILPFIKEKSSESKIKKTVSGSASGTAPVPFRSPRSNLPVRERIAMYVAERRKEDGLPVPEPLHPSRTGTSQAGARVPASAVKVASAPNEDRVSAGQVSSGGDDLGDIPLPDDFGSVDDSSRDMGSLPGLEDDLDDLGGFGGGDGMDSDFGSEPSGIADELPEESGVPASSPSAGLPDSGLPGFEGDIESDFGESDLMPDDGMMDLSGDDILTMDDDAPPASGSSPGGLSEEGLPDLDVDLEPDIMDSDLSGDDDFGDIEFMDLEPEEPRKKK